MATKTYPSTARPTTDAGLPAWLRPALLFGTYGLTILGLAGLSLAGTLYLNEFALPLAAQLGVWGLGLAGVLAAPSLARHAVGAVDDRVRFVPADGATGAVVADPAPAE